MKPFYQDSYATIYCADCREVLPDVFGFDLVLTDPPYGIAWKRGVNHQRASKAHQGIIGDGDTSARDWVLESIDVPAIVFGSFYAPVTGFRRDAEPIFLVGEWPFQTVQFSSVLHSPNGQSKTVTETGHPHTKPIDVVMRLVEFTEAETILDPFMGSGTTLVAAKRLGRHSIGIEIEEKYCEIAARRLEAETTLFDIAPPHPVQPDLLRE